MTVAVVCVMGLPGAGKSTQSRALCVDRDLERVIGRHNSTRNVHLTMVSFDEVEARRRTGEGTSFDPEAWRSARIEVAETIQHLRIDSGMDETKLHVVLLDDNFYYGSMRKRFRPNGIIFIDRSLDECKSINSARPKPVPAAIIERMALTIEIPESSVSQPVLTLRPSQDHDVSDLVQFVRQADDFWFQVGNSAIHSKVHGLTGPRALTFREELLNECEKKLRNCVSQVASKSPLKQADVKEISRLKADHLSEVKQLLSLNPVNELADDIIDSLTVRFSIQLAQFS